MNRTDVQATLTEMWRTRPTRPREGAEIAGVAAALGRRYAVDPVLVRIGFVVAAFYGVGALLYLAAWALLPGEPGADRIGARPRPWLVVGLTIGAVANLGTVLGGRGWLLPTLAVLGLLLLLHHGRAALGTATPAPGGAAEPPAGSPGAPTTAAGAPAAPTPQPPAWDPLGAAPFAWDLPDPGPAEPDRPTPRPAPVTAVTLAAALLAGGVSALAMLIGGGLDLPVLLGVVLAVLGTGLVLGAFLRTGRGLVPIAVLVAVLTWGVLAAPWERFPGDAGQVRLAPVTVGQVLPGYRHSAGAFELDLTGLDLAVPAGAAAPPLRTGISMGAGDVHVIVPRDADVTVRASAGLGRVAFDGREDVGPGPELMIPLDLGADGVRSGRLIELDVETGVGNVEVRRG